MVGGVGSGGGGQKGKRCGGTKFDTNAKTGGIKTDYQEGRLLESASSLPQGAAPRSVALVFENDLVDSLKAGADVVITGTIVHRWLPIAKGARAVLDVVLVVNSIALAGDAASGAGPAMKPVLLAAVGAAAATGQPGPIPSPGPANRW
jgi:hypothetical protein